MKFTFLLTLFSVLGIAGSSFGEAAPELNNFRVLVFSKTLLYRHASITNGVAAIKKLGVENGFAVDATEDATAFTSQNLSGYKAVVFLSTSGNVLNEVQEVALREFIENGGGFAGIHAAVAGDVATEGNWPWYREAFCTSFTNHSKIVAGDVIVEKRDHSSTIDLPPRWHRTDEWYNFMVNPREKVHVLASLDESTYQGGSMGKDHPIVWWKNVGKGRMWYTGLGHTEASYTEPLFLKHLLGGIRFVASPSRSD